MDGLSNLLSFFSMLALSPTFLVQHPVYYYYQLISLIGADFLLFLFTRNIPFDF